MRSARLAVAAVGTALSTAFFLFVDLGGVVRGALHPGSVLLAVAWSLPLMLYAWLVRTTIMTVTGGAVLLGATVWFLVAVFRDQRSTAAVGLVVLAALTYLAFGAVVAVDRLVTRGRGRG